MNLSAPDNRWVTLSFSFSLSLDAKRFSGGCNRLEINRAVKANINVAVAENKTVVSFWIVASSNMIWKFEGREGIASILGTARLMTMGWARFERIGGED